MALAECAIADGVVGTQLLGRVCPETALPYSLWYLPWLACPPERGGVGGSSLR